MPSSPVVTVLLLIGSNVFMMFASYVPFAVFYMRQPLTFGFVWAGLCLLGAVYFMFR